MKILLATDGSPSARHAEALAGAISWPAGTEIEALCVDQLFDGAIDLPPQRIADAHAPLRQETYARLAALVQQLSVTSRPVRARVNYSLSVTSITKVAGQLRPKL